MSTLKQLLFSIIKNQQRKMTEIYGKEKKNRWNKRKQIINDKFKLNYILYMRYIKLHNSMKCKLSKHPN